MSRRQSSIFSLGSLGLTFKLDESYYEDMTDSEIQQILENIAQTNLFLNLENDVYERHLIRQNPESLQAITQILETAKRMQRIMPQHVPSSPRSGSIITIQNKDTISSVSTQSENRHTPPSLLTSRTEKGGIKIPYSYRIELVDNEIQQLKKELMEVEQKSVKRKMNLEAQIKENETSIREVFEIREKFEKDVVEKGVDSITGKIPAEKFIRFTEECLKTADTLIERIRLKMMTTKIQKRKAKQQLKHRQELGEALRAVDFEQLNIENQDCIRKIDEKTQYLLEMKKIAGRYNVALNKYKGKLSNLTSTTNKVRAETDFQKHEIVKLQNEQTAVNTQIEKTQKQLKSLVELMDNFSVPEVMDCIKIHTELKELQKVHKRLLRQKTIQQIIFKSNK